MCLLSSSFWVSHKMFYLAADNVWGRRVGSEGAGGCSWGTSSLRPSQRSAAAALGWMGPKVPETFPSGSYSQVTAYMLSWSGAFAVILPSGWWRTSAAYSTQGCQEGFLIILDQTVLGSFSVHIPEGVGVSAVSPLQCNLTLTCDRF